MKKKIHSFQVLKTLIIVLLFLSFISQIQAQNIVLNGSADDCNDIGPEQILQPETDPNFQSIDYVCAYGSLEGATPDTISGCNSFLVHPTVWFKVELDDYAGQLFSTVETQGSWTPVWSIFYGNCDNLELIITSPPCSNDDDSPDLHQVGVENGWDIYIAVSAILNGSTIADPEFEICVATIINVAVCLGDIDDNCEPDPSVEIKITKREYADLEPDVDPEEGYLGPFCPGEELDVHIEFFYDATETGVDWLIGFVPDFGLGWDLEQFDFSGNPATGNGGPGQWLISGSDCEGRVAEPFPHLCTYTDEDGNLRLCNALCEACTECDELGMHPNDPLPNGYFWMSDGSNTNCVAGSCISSEQWGIGSTTSQIEWDFSMSVKDFASLEECMDYNDLQINFQTFSDGGAGCWEDPVSECLTDRKQLGPQWTIQCVSNTQVIASQNYIEIQSGESLNIDLSIVGGGTENIVVSTDNKPYILGNNEHLFLDGSGTINDTISLEDGIYFDQEFKYYLSLEGEEPGCGAFIQAITVNVIAPAVPNDICMNAIPVSVGDTLYSGLLSTTMDSLNLVPGCDDSLQMYSVWYKLDLSEDTLPSNIFTEILIEDNTLFNMSMYADSCDGELIASSCQHNLLFSQCIGGNVYYIQISAETEIPLFQLQLFELSNHCCHVDYEFSYFSELCEGDLFFLPIELIDGPGYIEWECSTNPNIFGQSNGLVYGDQYYIEQNLFLHDSVTEPQQLSYFTKAYLYHDELCTPNTKVHTVTIYPGVEIIQEDLIELCSTSLDSIDIRNYLNREEQNFEYFWQALDDNPDHFGFGHLIQLDDSYTPAAYQFKINITDNYNCTYVDTIDVFINQYPEAGFDFVIEESTVTFSNLSTGTNNYEWHFGDGQLSFDNEPIHTYSAEGDYEVILIANNTCGSDSTSIIISIDLSNTLHLDHALGYKIQPNPNQGVFDLFYNGQNPQTIKIEMLNYSGKKIYQATFDLREENGKISMDQTDLSSGLYFLKIMVDNKTHVLKWIKS